LVKNPGPKVLFPYLRKKDRKTASEGVSKVLFQQSLQNQIFSPAGGVRKDVPKTDFI
jgi:hypothetical protein